MVSLHIDWQAMASGLIVLGAAAYLARRWWPGLKGLFSPQAPRPEGGAVPCGTAREVAAGGAASDAAGGAACGSGCGTCGQGSAAPPKDHRVHIVRRAKS